MTMAAAAGVASSSSEQANATAASGHALWSCEELVQRPVVGQGSQAGISPEFRATWLSRREKKGAFEFSSHFSLFSCLFGAKKGRGKKRAQPWYARKSGIVLPQDQEDPRARKNRIGVSPPPQQKK